jgi:hypothetical protein
MNLERKISSGIAFLIIFLIILPTAWAAYRSWCDIIEATNYSTNITYQSRSGQNMITDEEKTKIDAWIKKEGLNEYGDPQDTVYTGGTPLFDESSRKSIDKYQYILSKHPDRPWEKW